MCKDNKNIRLPKFLPRNLDLEYIIAKNPPDFEYKRDCAVYILSLINEIPANNKDLKIKHGFVPVNATILKNRVKDYKVYLNYFINNGILKCDNIFKKGKKSKGYKYTRKYNTKLKCIYIFKRNLIKKIRSKSHKNHNYQHLSKWFNENLTIDRNAATKYIEKNYKNNQLQYNSYDITIWKIDNKEYWFNIDDTSYRLHTNLTNLKSELRKFIRYKGKILVSIDIANSQPYFSTVLFSEKKAIFFNKVDKPQISNNNNNTNNIHTTNKTQTHTINHNNTPKHHTTFMLPKKGKQVKNDVRHYISLVESGYLYNFFSTQCKKKLNITFRSRREVKDAFFPVIYGSISYMTDYKILFKELFPCVLRVFNEIKKTNKRDLPILLQTIESDIILGVICKRIDQEKPILPIFTIHDSVVTTSGNEKYIATVMEEELFKLTGLKPKLTIEYWSHRNYKSKNAMSV